MKRILLLCIPIFLTIITLGVVFLLVNKYNLPNVVYATKFSYKYDNEIMLHQNDEIALTKNEFNIEPANCTERIIFSTSTNDDNILEIDNQSNKIIAKNVGSCTLYAYIKSGPNTNLVAEINITVQNNTNNQDKETETYNYTYQLDDGFASISFNAGDNINENSINIISENGCIEKTDVEFNRLTIIFLAKGSAVIEIESYNKKVIINVTIV